MAEWKRVRLGEVADYVSEKSLCESVTPANYISTENMLPNKGGVAESSSLPSYGSVTAFKVGDILISNIRPYFKKIWQANKSGFSSNDVLVIRANEHVTSKYLFSVLSSDAFFEFVMAGAKGTKMPRGDKQHILEYPISLPTLHIQRKIAAVLGAIDDKIETNRKICANLEAQAQALFKSWFVDFEPFGGKMPQGWKEQRLPDVASFFGGYSYKGCELVSSDCAMATIKNFNRGGGFKLEGFKEIVPSSKLKPFQIVDLFDVMVAHTDLTQKAEVIGNAEMLLSKCGYERVIMSMDLVKVVPQKGLSKFLLALLLKNPVFKEHCLKYVNGTTVLHLSKSALCEYALYLPKDLSSLGTVSDLAESLYRKEAALIDESRSLAAMRDALLPKLMSGEIDVSKVEVA